jgi:hypothetical protein
MCSEVSASMATDSLLNSSFALNSRNQPRRCRASLMKSAEQYWVGRCEVANVSGL